MLTMSRRIFYMALGGIMSLAIVCAAIGGGTAVFAQEDETPVAPPTDEVEPEAVEPGFQGRRPQPGGLDDGSYLAEALGITVDELDAAREAVRAAQLEETVAQALADGLITEEQAEAILSGEEFGRGLRGIGLDRRGNKDEGDELLAAELDITVEELEAAKEAARDAALAQALEDGLITQEQIDLRAAAQALREYTDHEAVLADLLGLTVEELEAAKEDGSIRDLVEASGLTQEEIQAAMEEAHDAAVAQAIADGVITQEQADQLEDMPQRGHGGPRGGHGGSGGPRGGQEGPCGDGLPGGVDAPPTSDTINTTDA